MPMMMQAKEGGGDGGKGGVITARNEDTNNGLRMFHGATRHTGAERKWMML